MATLAEKESEFLYRIDAIQRLAPYIEYTCPAYIRSSFSDRVCAALDRFVADMQFGTRPVLVLRAPPQHGKSEIVSRRFPAWLMGRLRIGVASYADELANSLAQDVRRNLGWQRHWNVFPIPEVKSPYAVNRIGEFSSPTGIGSFIAVGIGAGLSGRSLDVGIIDDPVRDAKDALSETVKESQWNWYQSVFATRLGERSGQIVMSTSWAEDDLGGRIVEHFRGNPRLTHLRFPAINSPNETGYNPDLPLGPLCPEFRSLEFLLQQRTLLSDFWWSALYQQSPRSLGGNVFKEIGIQYYAPKDLPEKFDKVIASVDATFKDTDGTDYVVAQVWGKRGANTYLLDQVRDRMSFTKTVEAIIKLHEKWPQVREILIEDKANGPAVIDVLKGTLPGIIPVEPDGSKLARAHSITFVWEAKNIWLPYPQITPWLRAFVGEITAFPAAAHDDQVDAMTQALRRLYPLHQRMKISQAALNKAMGRA